MEMRRQLNDIFKTLKENNCQSAIIDLVKIPPEMKQRNCQTNERWNHLSPSTARNEMGEENPCRWKCQSAGGNPDMWKCQLCGYIKYFTLNFLQK